MHEEYIQWNYVSRRWLLLLTYSIIGTLLLNSFICWVYTWMFIDEWLCRWQKHVWSGGEQLLIESQDGSSIPGDITHIRWISIQLLDVSAVISVTRHKFPCASSPMDRDERWTNIPCQSRYDAVCATRFLFTATAWIMEERFRRRTSRYKSSSRNLAFVSLRICSESITWVSITYRVAGWNDDDGNQ